MTNSEIALYRLHNQRILVGQETTPAAIVSALGAVQGQDYPGARWSIGLRLNGSSDSEIEAAITNKEIVRAWVLRGTLHIVSANDIRWMLRLVSAKIIKSSATRYLKMGLDGKTIAQSQRVLTEALKNGKVETRKNLAKILQEHKIPINDFRLGFILHRASMDQLICFGPMQGKEQTFVLLQDWVPNAKNLSREESLTELARRFFASHGPATLEDFVWWSGLNVSDAKAGLEQAKPQLESETIGKQAYWMPQNIPELQTTLTSVFLLPGFDEFMLGYKDRIAIIDPKHWKHVTTNNGLFSNTIIINGRVEGTWKRMYGKNEIVIELTPFSSFKKSIENSVEMEARKFGNFMGIGNDAVKIVWKR